MAEGLIPVQPAQVQTQPAPAPMNVKVFVVTDGTGSPVDIQAVSQVDDYGNSYKPISEATGRAIIQLLAQLLQQNADNGQGLVPSLSIMTDY